MQPFVKWAGGKRQLIPELTKIIPSNFNQYFEPFIGGGALLLELERKNSVISDNNHVLIGTYNDIKHNLDKLLPLLDKLQNEHNSYGDKEKAKEFYYQQRDNFNQIIFDDNESLNRSALFLYLNKACFNGLYRVNSKGLFNVPSNQKTTINIYERDNLVQISQFLQTVDIYNQDFEETAIKAKKETSFSSILLMIH
ncbi:Methyl-directed repair DNA adenine methylase [Streptococcus sp. HSISS2]|uniref:DNA adenine methylase n=1 Tax=Streptococcus sp. HSISS2 TaxID=1316411 RepID=UPI00038B8917|nr:Methyl-directed repair DNA adenine methylase [Streptococcus sp. HSISS2]